MAFIDLHLVAHYNANAALLIERLFFLTDHSKGGNFCVIVNGRKLWDSRMVDGGMDWLVDQFTTPAGPAMTKRTLQNTIQRLEADGLLDVERGSSWLRLAINYPRLQELIGDEAFARYSALMSGQGEDFTPCSTSEDEKLSPSPDARVKNFHPESEELSPSSMKNFHPLYIEEDSEEVKEESIPDVDTSGASATPLKLASPMNVIHQMVFRHQPFAEVKGRLGAMLGQIKSFQQEGLPIVVDLALLEDYAVWYMLIANRWKGMFPDEAEFMANFGKYLSWLNAKDNQNRLIEIKQRFPDWRERLFRGEYTALQAEVDSLEKQGNRRNGHNSYRANANESPFQRTPEQRRLAGHRDPRK